MTFGVTTLACPATTSGSPTLPTAVTVVGEIVTLAESDGSLIALVDATVLGRIACCALIVGEPTVVVDAISVASTVTPAEPSGSSTLVVAATVNGETV